MSFTEFETSENTGEPIALYEFALGNRYWRYTNDEQVQAIEGIEFLPETIADDGVRQKNEITADNMTITVPRDSAVAALFVGAPPSALLLVTVRERHRGDPDAETIQIWNGRLVNVQWLPEESTAKLLCESILTSLTRDGPRVTFQVHCPWPLYSEDCGVDPILHRVAGNVSAVSGVLVDVPEAAGFPDGRFAGGYVEYEFENLVEKRYIEGHAGSQLILMGVPRGLMGGIAINLYRGCDKNPQTCDVDFANMLNYGGCPYAPEKTPFGGARIV